jgi:hypothetical protein
MSPNGVLQAEQSAGEDKAGSLSDQAGVNDIR